MTSTAAAIRDRMHALVEALTPTWDTRVKFRRFRNEGAGSFTDFAEANPAGCLRRFQIRSVSSGAPEVSDTQVDMRHATMTVLVAYPATGRYGADGALDRDDAMRQDFKKIEQAIGIYGRANFSSANDCTPLGNGGEDMDEYEHGATVSILRVTARVSYYATVGGDG